MSDAASVAAPRSRFPATYWVAILFEFFERGSYYGLMSVLSIYLADRATGGVLGFSKPEIGVINSVVRPLLYFLPIFTGALADRFGYRRMLLVAFSLLSMGYALSGHMTGYAAIFGTLVLMAVGAGCFKPVISGTIARTTDESNSGLGFGIFYWTINLGALLFPLILVPVCKHLGTEVVPLDLGLLQLAVPVVTDGWRYVFYLSAAGTGLMLIPTLFVYRDPPRPKSTKSIGEVLTGAVLVLKDVRFVVMIVIYSGFWILYFQMFDTVLWYLKQHMDMAPVEQVVNGLFGAVGVDFRWTFDAEHVTVINAGTIVALQLIVSKIVNKTKALPTMISGIAIGTLGMAMLAVSDHAWVFFAGIMVFSIGEMTAHPKYISYVGQIAPEDKKALYMGYSFLYGVIGSTIGGLLGGFAYERLVEKMHRPALLWVLFSLIGVATIVGLLLFNKFLAPKKAQAPSA